MVITRWKIMAGMLAASLGGLAAVSAQTPKRADRMKAPEQPAVAFCEPPLVIQASATVPVPAFPAPGSLPVPTVAPATFTLPAAPVDVPAPTPPAAAPLALPMAELPKPAEAPKAVELPKPPEAINPGFNFHTAATPAAAVEVSKPAAPPSAALAPPSAPALPVEDVKPNLPPVQAAPQAAAEFAPSKPAASKYKIMLRVGDGEPTVEVRSGDELVLKVLCDKVDVKAPTEKGQTLSAVKAMGKVRFVGFGSEGTCDELSFLAGTGEVSLTGAVKVQVKDKLGRVETELSGEKMSYKLDAASHLAGGLSP